KIVYEYNLAKHSATDKKPFRLLYQYPGYNTVLNITEIEKDKEVTWVTSIEASYLDRMDKHPCVHLSKHDFSKRDCVLVANDLDSNTKTKNQSYHLFLKD
ncbi:hypothetical protein NGRA_0422, partial [Nosema granulosis]